MESDQLFEALESVADETSFVRYVELLAAERRVADTLALSVDGFQGEWANQTIAEFLAAALAWAADSGFDEHPGPKASNPWQRSAHFLWAGRGYE